MLIIPYKNKNDTILVSFLYLWVKYPFGVQLFCLKCRKENEILSYFSFRSV